MRRIVLALCLALAACGGEAEKPYDPASDNHGLGYQFDAQGPRGLKLRFAPRYTAGDRLANPATYEQAFDELQTCSGLSAPVPPFVIIQPSGTLPDVNGLITPIRRSSASTSPALSATRRCTTSSK